MTRTRFTASAGRRGAVAADRDSDAAEQTMLVVGARIRAMRLHQKLTLRDVAERTGVSVSMLSMLERGVSTASVGTLVAVSSALGVRMYDLFAHEDGDASPVTTLAEQTVFRTGKGTARRVAHSDSEAGLELAINEYAPDGASDSAPLRHDGREVGVLISGQLTVELDGQSYVLEPGDAIAYSSDRPHRLTNNGSEPAVAVWVNVDPK